MELKVKRVLDNAVIPSVDADGLNLTCADILTEVGKDHRLLLIYRTGVEITIPAGHIGVITPTKLAPIYSLDDAAGLQVLPSGFAGEVVARYKVNTTSVPSIFEPGEIFAKLIIMPIVSVTLIEQIEEPKTAEENVEETGTTEGVA